MLPPGAQPAHCEAWSKNINGVACLPSMLSVECGATSASDWSPEPQMLRAIFRHEIASLSIKPRERSESSSDYPVSGVSCLDLASAASRPSCEKARAAPGPVFAFLRILFAPSPTANTSKASSNWVCVNAVRLTHTCWKGARHFRARVALSWQVPIAGCHQPFKYFHPNCLCHSASHPQQLAWNSR
jgi:hypothetical protein